MSDLELSAYQNAPLEFYTFSTGSNTFRFVSSDSDQVGPSGFTFLQSELSRDGSVSSAELAKNTLTITTILTDPVAAYFRRGQPDDIIKLLIQRKKIIDSVEVFVTVWQGRVVQCAWKATSADLVAEPISASVKRLGNRTRYMRLCRHQVYDNNCKVPKSSNQLVVNITAYNGNHVTINTKGSFSDEWFENGFITTALGASRMVVGVSGLILELTHPFNVSEIGVSAFMQAGCDNEYGTCYSRFNNLPRYGGFRGIPSKNPFADGAIDN